MGLRAILLAVGGALALTGCASSDYGYGYCYDPYQGPVGYYYGPFEPKPACATAAPRPAYLAGPYYGGYSGPYSSGPHTSAPQSPEPERATPPGGGR